jgi:hypothetical protein
MLLGMQGSIVEAILFSEGMSVMLSAVVNTALQSALTGPNGIVQGLGSGLSDVMLKAGITLGSNALQTFIGGDSGQLTDIKSQLIKLVDSFDALLKLVDKMNTDLEDFILGTTGPSSGSLGSFVSALTGTSTNTNQNYVQQPTISSSTLAGIAQQTAAVASQAGSSNPAMVGGQSPYSNPPAGSNAPSGTPNGMPAFNATLVGTTWYVNGVPLGQRFAVRIGDEVRYYQIQLFHFGKRRR